MPHTSLKKQRLLLIGVGQEVPEGATDEQIRAWAEEAEQLQGPPTPQQQELARTLGIEIPVNANRHDAAVKLYKVLLLRAWVYSVWRAISGETDNKYDQLSLPMSQVLGMARHMEAVGMFEQVQPIPTTDEPGGDVFLQLKPEMQNGDPFRFVASRLPTLPPKTQDVAPAD